LGAPLGSYRYYSNGNEADERSGIKLVGYLRVSTDRQVEEGLGLDVQRAAIRTWAEANAHRVVAWHSDEGISGSNGLSDRLGLAEALVNVRDEAAQGLVVYRLDRLARDLVLQEQLLGELWRYGGAVFSTSAGEATYLSDDPDDPSRRLIRQVLGAVNEYERAMIGLRLRSGRARKYTLGGYAFGAPPFGSRAEGGELVSEAAEVLTLQRVRELRSQGLSLRDIGRALESEGHTPRRSEHWHPKVLASMLRRDTART
jgi:DNA invertase Pin-like site-specific DNA recombinase